MVPLCKKRDANKYEKHFQKMYRDVGMAMSKTTETRCRDGSVQGRHTKTTQLTPSLHLFFWLKNCSSQLSCSITHRMISDIKKDVGMGLVV